MSESVTALLRARTRLRTPKPYVPLRMRSVIRHLHDVCAVHIRRNGVRGHSNLLVVKWLGLSVTG